MLTFGGDESVLVCREFSWDLVEIFSEAIVSHYTPSISIYLYCTACRSACGWTSTLRGPISAAF